MANEQPLVKQPGKRLLFIALHIMLWCVVCGFFYMAFTRLLSSHNALLRAVMVCGILIAVFYINALLLVNKLLEKRKWGYYILGLLLLIFVSTRLRIAIEHSWMQIHLPPIITALTRTRRGLVFLPVFFTLIVSTFYQLLLNRQQAEKQYLVRINELNEAALLLLKAQINPHFLFNHLNNIYSLIITSPQQAGDAVLQLSSLLRYAIYKSGEEDVALTEEWAQLKNLAGLYAVKDEELRIELNSPEETWNARIEPMILFPIAENCFKHCDNTINPAAFIRISLKITATEITFITENTTFPQHHMATADGQGGIGLRNIQQRLDQRYGRNYSFEHGRRKDHVYYTQLQIQWNRAGNA